MSMLNQGASGSVSTCIEALEGFAPGYGRSLLVRPDSIEESPPLHLLSFEDDKGRRQSRDFYRVRFWLERNTPGRVIKVFCFACGACFLDQWTTAHYGDRQRVRPMLDGGMIVLDGRELACRCFSGKPHRNSRPEASPAEMKAAERESFDRETAAIVHRAETGGHQGFLESPFWTEMVAAKKRAKASVDGGAA